MNVKTLVERGGDKPLALYCGECALIYPLHDEAGAERCCKPYTCRVCGKDTERPYHLICRPCEAADLVAKEQARLQSATVVEWNAEAGAWLYDAENDRWIQDVEDAEEGEPPTRYAYACKPDPLRLDADSILESVLSDHYDDAYDDIGSDARERLQRALDEWTASANIISYEPDYSRVVVFDPALAPTAAE